MAYCKKYAMKIHIAGTKFQQRMLCNALSTANAYM